MIGLRERILPERGRNDPAKAAPRQPMRVDSRADEERFRAQSSDLDARFYHSIRFKLTAWYASILILVLVASGLALQILLTRALDADVDQRLLLAENEIVSQTNIFMGQEGTRRGSEPPREELLAFTPKLTNLQLSGLWVGVYIPETGEFQEAVGALSQVPLDLNAAIRQQNLLDVRSTQFGTVVVDDSKTRVLAHPFIDPADGTIVKIVLIGESLGSQGRIMTQIDQVLQIAGAIGIAMAAWGGWLLAGRVLSPVERLTRTAVAIGSSDGRVSLSRRLEVPQTGDELSRLATTFNTMLDRIEAAFMVQRRFVSDASHELRTPLTSIRGNVDVLQRQLKSGRAIAPGEMAEALGDVQRESARMGRLIDDLLVLARNDAAGLGYLVKPEPVSLDVVAREAYRTATALVEGQRLSLQTRDEVMVHGDGDRLVQVMLILIDNALRHTPAGGSVELRVGRATDERENVPCALIEVEDSGQGISIDHVPHLFQRFYRIETARSRPSGGTGLGLAIALAIVRGHHGWIDVETAPGQGTTFSVWLPLIEYISANPDPAGSLAARPALPSGPES